MRTAQIPNIFFEIIIVGFIFLKLKKNRGKKTWLFSALVICRLSDQIRKRTKIRLSKKFRKSEIPILAKIRSSSKKQFRV